MKRDYKIKTILLAVTFCIIATLNAQQTYTFTNAGATGANGPTQGQINTAYLSTNLNGAVTVSNGIQSWTVPTSGNYRIEARGAQGGGTINTTGGLGATMVGTFALVGGEVIKILVGQEGDNGGSGPGGGGGGSFVVRTPYTTTASALIIAGGGSGNGNYAFTSGVITTAGSTGGVAGGTNGSGGLGGTRGAGGGGFLTNGNPCTGSALYANPGLAFINGGLGGVPTNQCSFTAAGGFGGGSSHGGNCINNGGAGGGFSGGGGSSNTTSGGGGSLNTGTNQLNTAGNNSGHGRVLITELCNISLTASGTNSLNPSICSGQSVTLTTNAISNYVWSNGNTTTNSIVVSPGSTTVYTLSATSPAICTAAKSITVNVSGGLPVLSVVSSTNQTCLGKTATLTASGAVTYTWTNGVTNGVSFNPTVTTTYTITGENGCGTTTAVSTISVDPLPVSVVSTNTSLCANQTVTLSVTAAATSYTWEPGNIINNNPNLIVSPQANTMYTITASDGTCSGVANISLQSNPVPTLNASASSTVICPGGSITLSVTGANNYTWTPGNQTGSLIVVNPSVSTLYNVLGDNTFGCTGTTQQIVVVGAPPSLTLSANAYTICNGGSSTLSATGANNYIWTNGPSTTNYAVTPNVTTTYTVDGSNTNNPCTANGTIQITVVTPVLTISGNTTICNGESTNLTASGVSSYTWAHVGAQGAITTVSPSTSTTYTVNATSSVNIVSCPVVGVVNVVVYQKPTLTALPARTSMCPKESNTITVSGASTYTWMSVNTNTTGTFVEFNPQLPGLITYTVSGSSAQGCVESVLVFVNVSICQGLNELNSDKQVTIYPNPNNGEFIINAEKEMTLSLINELGQLVKKLDVNSKNTYQISIANLPNGIYFVVGEGVNKKIVVNK